MRPMAWSKPSAPKRQGARRQAEDLLAGGVAEADGARLGGRVRAGEQRAGAAQRLHQLRIGLRRRRRRIRLHLPRHRLHAVAHRRPSLGVVVARGRGAVDRAEREHAVGRGHVQRGEVERAVLVPAAIALVGAGDLRADFAERQRHVVGRADDLDVAQVGVELHETLERARPHRGELLRRQRDAAVDAAVGLLVGNLRRNLDIADMVEIVAVRRQAEADGADLETAGLVGRPSEIGNRHHIRRSGGRDIDGAMAQHGLFAGGAGFPQRLEEVLDLLLDLRRLVLGHGRRPRGNQQCHAEKPPDLTHRCSPLWIVCRPLP